MSRYVIIPRIEVKGANAQSAWWLVSGPSPLAWVGLVRKLAIDLGIPDHHKIKVAILHHDLEMRGEMFYGNLHPYQMRGAALTTTNKGASSDYVSGSMSMGLQPVALCNLTATLVIEGMENVYVDALRERLLCSRLAGGTIQTCGRINKNKYARQDILKSVSNGFFLKERSDLLSDIPCDQRIETFVRQFQGGAEGDAWLAPMNLGFLALTPAVLKPNTRARFPHAYAEPLVGLVQYISKRTLDDSALDNLFWGYQQQGSAFVVKNI